MTETQILKFKNILLLVARRPAMFFGPTEENYANCMRCYIYGYGDAIDFNIAVSLEEYLNSTLIHEINDFKNLMDKLIEWCDYHKIKEIIE